MQIAPVNDILATTVIVTQIPDSVLLQQLSKAQDLQTLWMIVAIVLFVLIAVVVISFGIILGCTSAVKRKAKVTDFPKAVKMKINDDYMIVHQ